MKALYMPMMDLYLILHFVKGVAMANNFAVMKVNWYYVHSLQFGRWSTLLFRYYLLGGDTVAPSGLLARLCHVFLVLFIFYYEHSYLSIYWSDFHDLFTKWKVFAWIFLIRSSFSDSSRDIAMATNFSGKNGQNCLPSLHLSLSHSETGWGITTSMCALTAQMMPLYRVKISWTMVL